MGQVIILEETTKYPITLMGRRAGICWGGGRISLIKKKIISAGWTVLRPAMAELWNT